MVADSDGEWMMAASGDRWRQLTRSIKERGLVCSEKKVVKREKMGDKIGGEKFEMKLIFFFRINFRSKLVQIKISFKIFR